MQNHKWTIIVIVILGITALALLVMYLDFAADMNRMATPYPTDTIDIPATMTKFAKPTNPPPTMDTRSDFEKCVQSRVGVIYILYGTASYADITWKNQTNGTEQGAYNIPFCVAYRNYTDNFVYISAQIQSKGGDLTCEIIYQGKIIAKARAVGFPNIASCSTSLP